MENTTASLKQARRIGILGGSFDPVHNGHLGMARDVLKRFDLDLILFIPAHISPHKQKAHRYSEAVHRLTMLRLATQSEPRFAVSEIELQRGGISYTIDTVETLRKENPAAEFFLILGRDTFQDFNTWKNHRRLLESCNIIVGARPGHPNEFSEKALKRLFADPQIKYEAERSEDDLSVYLWREKEKRLSFFEITPRDISSREIRQRVARKGAIKNMLPANVERYIIDNLIYQTESHPFME